MKLTVLFLMMIAAISPAINGTMDGNNDLGKLLYPHCTDNNGNPNITNPMTYCQPTLHGCNCAV